MQEDKSNSSTPSTPTLSALQSLLFWLTGVGEEEAVYGMLAEMARTAQQLATPRYAATIVVALPLGIERDHFWQVGTYLSTAWPRTGIPAPLDEQRVKILTNAIVEAFDAAGMWDWLSSAKTVVQGVPNANALFQTRIAAVIQEFESHIPVAETFANVPTTIPA